MTDRYLVEFQEIGKDYFKADCAFREGQEDRACQYARLIVANLKHVIAGRVLDMETGAYVYTLLAPDKLAVNIELHLHSLANDLCRVERSVLHGALSADDATAVKQRLIEHTASQIANLMQS